MAKKKIDVKKESLKGKIKSKEPPKKKKKKPSVEESKSPLNPIIAMKNELDVTKDNLRLFVERWREHPNSPYMMDDDSGNIATNLANESMSLRGQSPSPRQSICSTLSDVSCSPTSNKKFFQNIPTIGIERRASEGTSKQLQSRDPASQIILAEEIIKLSEHLRSMAMSPTDNSRNTENKKSAINNNDEKSTDIIDKSKNKNKKADFDKLRLKKLDNETSEINEISEKLSTITKQRKLRGTTFNVGRSFEQNDSNNNNNSPPFILQKSSLKQSDLFLSQDDNNNKNEREKLLKTNSLSKNWKSEIRRDLEIDRNLDKEIDLTPPWRRSRAKHRFGEICRDVPRITNLRNIHKSIDLDEPTSTKNLLLQLLGEWEERPGIGGRKSISVDWSQESVARRSMNSLAEYFSSIDQNKSSSVSHPSKTYR